MSDHLGAVTPVPVHDQPGDLALHEGVLPVEERLAQLAADGALAQAALDDPDEALFQMMNFDDQAPGAPAVPGPAILPAAGGMAAILAAGPLPAIQGPQGVHALSESDTRRAMGMRQISELNGYGADGALGRAIRGIGRKLFCHLPCFSRTADAARARNLDPLGQIWVMTTMPSGNDGAGQGQLVRRDDMYRAATIANDRLNALVNWMTNEGGGRMVDAAVVRFPSMPGYSADVILYATQDETYMVVREQPVGGAPFSASYCYSWLGGEHVYGVDGVRNPLDAMAQPDARGARHVTVERVALPGARLDAPRAASQAPEFVPQFVPIVDAPRQHTQAILAARRAEPRNAPVPPVVQPARNDGVRPLPPPVPPGADRPVTRRAAGNATDAVVQPARTDVVLPPLRNHASEVVAPVARTNTMQVLRAAGFSPVGTDDGPGVRKDMPDGGHVIVVGDGRSLPMATSFVATRHHGGAVDGVTLASVDEVLEWVSNPPTAPSP